MRRTRPRGSLPPAVRRYLLDPSRQPSGATLQALKQDADRIWENFKRASAGGVRHHTVIKRRLFRINYGANRCMYCEDNRASTIDHHCPIQVAPSKVLHWPNMILACADCNSRKSASFSPDLLDPTHKTYRFEAHFRFIPSSGELRPQTPRAQMTVAILDTNDKNARRYRRSQFIDFQYNLQTYALLKINGDPRWAEVRNIIRGSPYRSLLDVIKHLYKTKNPILSSECSAAIARCPEILRW